MPTGDMESSEVAGRETGAGKVRGFMVRPATHFANQVPWHMATAMYLQSACAVLTLEPQG